MFIGFALGLMLLTLFSKYIFIVFNKLLSTKQQSGQLSGYITYKKLIRGQTILTERSLIGQPFVAMFYAEMWIFHFNSSASTIQHEYF